ncbi:MAG: polysaccharide deacetylase family protein [Lachnospiraceae bacterium]|nr:polysaccharide deacetylase family protein [Lachnospiraceae bacterium]
MANLIMRFPKGKPKALTLSYDDGVEQDEKLLEITAKYGLKGTFNINSGCFPDENVKYEAGTIHRRMPLERLKNTYKDSGWEIAAHAYTHAALVGLPGNLATREVIKDRKTLEDIFGNVIRGFAYPYGAYDDDCVEILRACGMVYARTVNSSHDFFIPKDWLRLPATCHHDDPMLMDLVRRFTEAKNSWHPMLFYLWGHSYEFEANDNWEVLENFSATVGGRDDIWYATNIEIYDYCDAFGRLIFDTDMKKCINPSATDLWFTYDDKDVFAPAGGTVAF